MASQILLCMRNIGKFRHNLKAYSTLPANDKKGLVLGVYTNEQKGQLVLTTAAEEYNKKTEGRLLTQLVKVASDLKKGGVRVFYCLDEEHVAVSVVGINKRSEGYDELEEIDRDKEAARHASGVGAKALQSLGISDISVEDFGDPEASAEGAHLAIWQYQELKQQSKRKPVPLIRSYSSSDSKLWQSGTTRAKAQNEARRLMETPANLMTPTIFANNATSLFKPYETVEVEAHSRDWAMSQNMGAFLSVAQGSAQPPVFLELTYRGTKADVPPVAFVGKGVTFDSGGISIKPSAGMEEMRGDMGGAACVLASIYAAASLQYPINIKGFIPLCENMPSSTATKPGDVVIAKNGKTIQVDNTDAEGRLILADALSYADNFKPHFTLDAATLTGAMRIALGGGATGVFTNSSTKWMEIQKAGSYTGDRMWRFPLWQHYTKRMTDYPSVDVNNVGQGKGGGACTAAAFLREFIGAGDWMHLDIAGVMGSNEDIPYLSKGMTGRPTRTLVQLLQQLSSKQ